MTQSTLWDDDTGAASLRAEVAALRAEVVRLKNATPPALTGVTLSDGLMRRLVEWIKACSSYDGRQCYQPHVLFAAMTQLTLQEAEQVIKEYQ